ncbi:aldo-keto reductase family 1 member B1 isoform X2 [Cryptotermes secundus]|uniref:aldo-keto reductase family 1 member B1 isoform X2 n=1 Tax=Cryptotermes secundus TaxID=105785 RepID=UPI001454DEE6|nr:aldo-keto reductase family 1 member B1 isoform X2 [Cryptotermes secundus]
MLERMSFCSAVGIYRIGSIRQVSVPRLLRVTSPSVRNMAQTVKLNNGYEFPVLGLGTYKSNPGEAEQIVKDAIDIGYRHIDCAKFYENEKEVGAGIRAKIAEGVIKREDIFVTSKLWNTYHAPHMVVPTCKRTLSDLGLDYVNLYLIHWPHAFKEGDVFLPKDSSGNIIYSDVDYVDTWKEMEECVKQGLTKSIGLSNFNSQQIQRVECHPYLNQTKLIDFCKKEGLVVTGYSPFGGPASIALTIPDAPAPLKDAKIKELAEKRGKTPAQIILRYLIQHGVVPIPKSSNKNRLQENFDALKFELTPEEVAEIDAINTNTRICIKTELSDHKHYPFSLEF